MVFIENNMPDSPFKESIKDKSAVKEQLVKLCFYMLCIVLYASICDKGHLGIRSQGIVKFLFSWSIRGKIHAQINLVLSPLFVHIPIFIVNIYFEFQVYMFRNGRDITKCHSFCIKTTTMTPRL